MYEFLDVKNLNFKVNTWITGLRKNPKLIALIFNLDWLIFNVSFQRWEGTNTELQFPLAYAQRNFGMMKKNS